jgi:hypothetical protein
MRLVVDVFLKNKDCCDGCPMLNMVGAGALMCGLDYIIDSIDGSRIAWKRERARRPRGCIDRFGE